MIDEDDIFAEEVDEEAAAERARAAENEKRKSENSGYNNSNSYYYNQTSQNTGYAGPDANAYGTYNGPVYGAKRRADKTMAESGHATAALVLGIIALVTFVSFINIILAVLALVFGLLYLCKKGKNTAGMVKAIVGIAAGIISVVLCFYSYSKILSNDNLSNLFGGSLNGNGFYFEYGNGSDDDLDEFFRQYEQNNGNGDSQEKDFRDNTDNTL